MSFFPTIMIPFSSPSIQPALCMFSPSWMRDPASAGSPRGGVKPPLYQTDLRKAFSSHHTGLLIIIINEIMLVVWMCSRGNDASADRKKLEFSIQIKTFVPVDTSYKVVEEGGTFVSFCPN